MNSKTQLVYAGLLGLTVREWEDLTEAIDRYNALPEYEKQKEFTVNRESAQKAHLGPMSSNSCPCCGR